MHITEIQRFKPKQIVKTIQVSGTVYSTEEYVKSTVGGFLSSKENRLKLFWIIIIIIVHRYGFKMDLAQYYSNNPCQLWRVIILLIILLYIIG